MIMKIYRAILWFLGFTKGDYITYMLRRQEARLGVWWWFIVFGTQTALILAVQTTPWWFPQILTIIITALVGWLAWHVDNAKLIDPDVIGTDIKPRR
jgi:hypothetical protein